MSEPKKSKPREQKYHRRDEARAEKTHTFSLYRRRRYQLGCAQKCPWRCGGA